MSSIPRDYDSPERRLRQLRRCLTIIDLIQSRRFGITINEIVFELRECLDDYCARTIRRDLESLELLAFVESRRIEGSTRWFWLGGPQARSLERAASQMTHSYRVAQ